MEKLYERVLHGNTVYVELAGASSETPPTENIAAGSWFHEVDTGLLKSFDAVSGEWVTQIELGGVPAAETNNLNSTREIPVIETPSDEPEEPEEPTEPAGSDER